MVDASVLVAFYAADDPRRSAVSDRLAAGNTLFAPAHLDAEVVSALRGVTRRNPALAETMPRALKHLAGFPIRRMPLAPMIDRMWQLRDTVTPYDAAYVALAERLDGDLITCDSRLARSNGPLCAFDLVS